MPPLADVRRPGAEVLENRFNLASARELRAVERAFTTARLVDLYQQPVRGEFNLAHLAGVHHAIFRDVYPWAGQYRASDLVKPLSDRESMVFAPKDLVVSKTSEILRRDVAHQDYSRMSRDEFVEHAARVYLDVDAVHPFLDGNARVAREFTRTMGLKAGFQLDWERLDKVELYEATRRSTSDRKDPSLQEQLAAAVVNNTRSPALAERWDRYVAGETQELRLPRPDFYAPRTMSLREAVAASARGRGPVAFVSAAISEARSDHVLPLPVLTAQLSTLEATREFGHIRAPIYGVRANGAIYDSKTQADVFQRVDLAGREVNPRLHQATSPSPTKGAASLAKGKGTIPLDLPSF